MGRGSGGQVSGEPQRLSRPTNRRPTPHHEGAPAGGLDLNARARGGVPANLARVITLGWMPTNPNRLPSAMACKDCRLLTTRNHPVLRVPICTACCTVTFDYRIVSRNKAIEAHGARPRELKRLRFGAKPNTRFRKAAPMQLYLLKEVMEIVARRGRSRAGKRPQRKAVRRRGRIDVRPLEA